MRIHVLIAVVGFVISGSGVLAQSPEVLSAPPIQAVGVAAGMGEPRVVEQGPHHKVVQTITEAVGMDGLPTLRTNTYIQLETGLSFLDGKGNWSDAVAEFDLVPGGAVARQTQSALTLAPDANSDMLVDAVLPDGQRLQSRPLGLGYFDRATGKSVTMAEVKESRGQLLPSNSEVLYPDAFEGVSADLKYVLSKSGWEQFVILREQPPAPEKFGLDSATCQLQMITEFVTAAKPEVTPRTLYQEADPKVRAALAEPDEVDDSIDFGSMAIGAGKAFNTSDDAAEAPGEGLPVLKHFETIEGRSVLFEAVAYGALKESLGALPPRKEARWNRSGKAQATASLQRTVPNKRIARRDEAKSMIRLAQAPSRRIGLAIDYTTVNSTLTNYVFKSGVTYYVSGQVSLWGTSTVFQAASILKYAPTNTAKVSVNTPIDWQGAPYRPVVLTARDDPTVGEWITNATLSGYYADTALEINASTAGATMTLQNLRIAWARTGLAINGRAGHVISHAQLVNCQTGVRPSSTDLSLRNALFYNVLTNFNGTSSTSRLEHLTVDGGSWLNYNGANTVYATNSLLVVVTNLGTIAVTNSTAVLTNLSGVFQPVGAGYHYLPGGSAQRNAGTANNVNAQLLRELRTRTTEAPQVRTDVLTNDSTFSPQVWRDKDLPDRGYHYDAIDYAVGYLMVSNATLSVRCENSVLGMTNDTTIAHFGPYAGGIWVVGDGNLCVQGTPVNPVRFTRFAAVQEQTIEWGGAVTNAGGGLMFVSPGTTGSVSFKFAQFDAFPLSPPFYPFYLGSSRWNFRSLLMRDSGLFLGTMGLSYPPTNATPTVTLVNNVFEKAAGFVLDGQIKLDGRNNLFRNINFEFNRGGTAPWTLKDNVFETCAIFDYGIPIDNGYNAYISTTDRPQSSGSHDIALTNFTYLTLTNGFVGQYYQGSTNLYDQGSRAAAAANLSDYTVTTNQSKEAGSTVDIGFHYVAMAGGLPIDTDADGIPDYIENHPGECYCESCVAPTVTLTSPAGGAWFITSPTNIVLTATASDADGWVSKVEFYNGTVKLGESTAAPYQYVWSAVPAGAYTLTARAIDNESDATLSSPVGINVNALPVITWVNPAQNTTNIEPATVTLEVNVTDPDGSVTNVQFLTNSTVIATLWAPTTSNIYRWKTNWSSIPAGDYPLYAKATDSRGVSRLSEPRLFHSKPANDIPNVVITSPAGGATFKAWADLTVTAKAFDSNGVAQVDFYAGTNFLGSDTTAEVSGGTTNFTVTVRGMKPGTYALTARAKDGATPAARNLSLNVPISVNQPEPVGNGFWDPVFGNVAPSQYPTYMTLAVGDAGAVLAGRDSFSGSDQGAFYYQWSSCVWGWRNDSNRYRVCAILPRGQDIYVAGQFVAAGPLANLNYVARWNGTAWNVAGNGLTIGAGLGLCALANVNGDLFVGGDFTAAGGDGTIQYVAKLAVNTTNWAKVGNGLNGRVRAIASIRDTLYIGGDFTSAAGNGNIKYLAQWNGTTWTNVGSGVDNIVHTLAVQGDDLFVGGEFTAAGGLTNVNYLAKWDGVAWSRIGGGVSGGGGTGGSDDPTNTVDSIVVRGNELYAGGQFTRAWNGTNAIIANYVARALWDAESRDWSWSGLEGGVGADFAQSVIRVRALALRERTNTNGYDLIVAGRFNLAGGLPCQNITRWVVGQSECSTSGPSVQISSPNPDSKIPGASVVFAAAAQATGTNTIAKVDFFLNGNFAVAGVLNGSFWSETYPSLTPGPCTLKAVATDSAGQSASSAPVNFTCVVTTNLVANADTFHVLSSGAITNLNVLANDTSTNGVLRVVGVNTWANPFAMAGPAGPAAVGADGTNLVYRANPYAFGTNVLSYDVTAGTGTTNAGWATVIVHALPAATITAPTNGATYTSIPQNLTITGTARDYDGSISNVTLYVNGAAYGSPTTSSNFTFNWSSSTAGFHTFVAVARDNEGNTNGSPPVLITIDPPGGTPPIADITNLINDTTSQDTVVSTNYPVLRDGLFDLRGYARDTNVGDVVSYQVLLRRPGETTDFANVTPGSLNYYGFVQSGNNYGDNNGDLGVLNLSAIPNGTYDLILRVRSNGDEAIEAVRILVDNQLKLGQFTFSEQDLVIPVGGIPLTVIRTYDSLNQVPGDFGYNWTYALNDLDVSIDEDRAIAGAFTSMGDDPLDATPNLFSLRVGGGHNVTLTLPGGQRTTFAFKPRFASYCAYAEWQAAPGVTAKLKMADDNIINFFGGPVLNAPYFAAGLSRTPFEAYDIRGFDLTLQDGTRYELRRDPAFGTPTEINFEYASGDYRPVTPYPGKLKLTNIVQRTGDRIVIDSSGILHKDTNGVTTHSILFKRDSAGRIKELRDPVAGANGAPVVIYTYNQDTGNLIQVLRLTDRAAQTYTTNTYHYDAPAFPHYITSIDNASGVPIARNEYDSLGRLVKITDADGKIIQYVHDTTNKLERVIDRMGNTNTFAYDTRGNVIAVTNALGTAVQQVSAFGYDDAGNQIAATNALGIITRIGYDTNNLPIAVTNGFGGALVQITTTTYDNTGLPWVTTDARGFSSTNFYDSRGLLEKVGNADGIVVTNSYDSCGMLVWTADATGAATTNYYDSATGYLTRTSAGYYSGGTWTPVATTTYGYDANGNQIAVTNALGFITRSGYDAQNRVAAVTNAFGLAEQNTSQTVYDPNGRVARTINALGVATAFGYDAQGRRTSVTNAVGTAVQQVTTYAYDAEGNRTNSVDALQRTTSCTYDALSRLIQTVYPDTTTNRTVYDALGRAKYTVDGCGVTNAFGYDVAGRRVAATNAWGSSVALTSLYGYDANGNQITATNGYGSPSQTVVTNVFDALNRHRQTLFPDGTKVSTSYDAAGRRLAETNQDNLVTRYGYDGLGRLAFVTNALTQVTRYECDPTGSLLRQVDALNRTNTFGYDSMGRRISHQLPGKQAESFGYDLAGNLVRHTNCNGVVITNQFDPLNRLTNRASANGYRIGFAYSATGQRTNMTDLSGTTAYRYDARDRLTNEVVTWTGGPTVTLKYRYDANGNVTNLWSSSTSGVTNVYQYDALNRLTNVLAGGGLGASYGYDTVGNLQTVLYGNAVTNLHQYDRLNRLTNAVWKLSASTLGSFYYQLRSSGNRTGLSETVGGASRTYQWQYDPLYRLTNEVVSALGSAAYRYDAVGNRTNRTSTITQLPTVNSSYNTNDWLVGDLYDNNGNTRTNASGQAYLYDAENRLTNYNGGAVVLTYNGDGSRVKKVVGAVTTYYVVEDRNPSGYAQVVEEWTSTGTPTLAKVYNYGLDLISQRTLSPTATTNYFVYDGHGSTRLLLDAGGNVTNAFAYDSYGTLIASNAAPQTAYLYCGEQYDSDAGLYYLRARYYKPDTGRFWTADTFQGNQGDPLSLHKYLYCQANPANGRDPSGHDGDMGSLVTTMGQIGYVAGRSYAAVSNLRWAAYARLVPVVEKGWQAVFWADVITTTVGAAAIIAPEALNLATDLGTRINRAYSMNTTPIPPGWGAPNGYGSVIENIGGQELEAMGGKYVGGSIKGIDGTLGIGQANMLVSFKAHDVAEDNLIESIRRDMANLQALDPEAISGTTINGKPFQFEGAVSGRVTVIAVPANRAQYIISPQFIDALRILSEETKTVPIVRAVRNWTGRSR